MPAAARHNDTFNTGHPCDGTSAIAQYSPDVSINSRGAARQGDNSYSHEVLVGGVCVPHTVPISGGSSTVTINNKPAARIFDSIDAGAISSGSPDVTIGG